MNTSIDLASILLQRKRDLEEVKKRAVVEINHIRALLSTHTANNPPAGIGVTAASRFITKRKIIWEACHKIEKLHFTSKDIAAFIKESNDPFTSYIPVPYVSGELSRLASLGFLSTIRKGAREKG